jgi:threonine dehydrogenase-like Zn-dependent dehydrogenase
MRAIAVFPAEHSIRLIEDHPEPSNGAPHEVSLQVLEVGICGTDREIARFDYGEPPQGSSYLVLGHEALARVLAVGSAVADVAVGDLVVPMVRRPCPHPACRACARGRQDFCFTGDFSERGIRRRHGFLTEQVVEEERYLHVVPPSLRSVGVLVEPLTIAEKALQQVSDVQDRLPWTLPGTPPGEGHGQRALVLGAGPVGLLGCLALLLRGFETWVYSLEPPGSLKAEWVASVGAGYVSGAEVPVAQLEETIGSIDLVYEATGAAKVSFQALEELGTNGVFVFTGVPGRKSPIEIHASSLMRRLVLENQLVFGTVNAGPDAFQAAISDLARFQARWPEALASLITGRYPLSAYAELLSEPRFGIKRVVCLEEDA